MAGKGRAPSPSSSVRPRGIPTRRLVNDGSLNGPDLPAGILPDGEQWHPQTVSWWKRWRQSPQAARMITEPDWDYLLDTALLHHQMWTTSQGRLAIAAELRLRVAKFGATPEDRLRLRLEIDEPIPFPVGTDQASKDAWVSVLERKARLTAVPRNTRVVNDAGQVAADG